MRQDCKPPPERRIQTSVLFPSGPHTCLLTSFLQDHYHPRSPGLPASLHHARLAESPASLRTLLSFLPPGGLCVSRPLGRACSGCLPEPSPLASSGSSCRLSFHSRGASQGVTVTDSGVLSSSTAKKYLREAGPLRRGCSPCEKCCQEVKVPVCRPAERRIPLPRHGAAEVSDPVVLKQVQGRSKRSASKDFKENRNTTRP